MTAMKTLENTEGANKNEQSKETGATYGTQSRRRRKTKQKHNTICVGHHYAQTNTHDVNSLLFMVFNTTFNNISVIS
jgi:hypothetical protein